jgi:hypothetical protein
MWGRGEFNADDLPNGARREGRTTVISVYPSRSAKSNIVIISSEFMSEGEIDEWIGQFKVELDELAKKAKLAMIGS